MKCPGANAAAPGRELGTLGPIRPRTGRMKHLPDVWVLRGKVVADTGVQLLAGRAARSAKGDARGAKPASVSAYATKAKAKAR